MPIDPLTGQPFMPDTPPPPPPANTEVRTRRVDEFEKLRLDDPDPLEACLGAMQADLLRISFKVADVLKRQLAGEDLSVDTINDSERVSNAYLRYCRQIERICQFGLRQTELERSKSLPPSSAEPTSTSGPLEAAGARARTPK